MEVRNEYGQVIGRAENESRGKLPQIRPTLEGDNLQINIGGTNVTINRPTYLIANDPKCRKHMAGVDGPLARTGVDTVTAKSGHFTQSTEKAEAEYFAPPESRAEYITKNIVDM